MSRFIRIPVQERSPKDMVIVNADHVEQIGFSRGLEESAVFIFMSGTTQHIKAVFKNDDLAIDFIEKNFVLFNA